jgi:uncharacterized protein with von Willebrand factor type A (vWA) domain
VASHQRASSEKSHQIDVLRGSIRGLEEQIVKCQAELAQVQEDYALRAKRQSLEEETLRKRLQVHERNARELAERLREAENRHQGELETLNAQSEVRVGELIIEKSEVKERLMAIERASFTLKKERDDAMAGKVTAESELKIVKAQLEGKIIESAELKTSSQQL